MKPRETALVWWNKLESTQKQLYYVQYFVDGDQFTIAQNHSQLTGREIEKIWRIETEALDIEVPAYKAKHYVEVPAYKAKHYVNPLNPEEGLKKLNLSELQSMLDKSISDEDYELAAKIRDEIKSK